MVVKLTQSPAPVGMELLQELPANTQVLSGHKPRRAHTDGFHRAQRSSLPAVEVDQGPVIVEGLRSSLRQLQDPAIPMSLPQLVGRLRALTKGIDAARANGSSAVEATWLATAAVNAAEARTAAFPKHTMALKHAFDGAWGATFRLESQARNTVSEASVEALLKHARAGGTEPVAELLIHADALQKLSAQIANERAAGPIQGSTLEELKVLKAKLEPLLKYEPTSPLEQADLLAMKQALRAVDVGTEALYQSAFQALEKQKNALRPPIPSDAVFINSDSVAVGYVPITLVVERLLEKVGKVPVHTKVNEELMLLYPSDKATADPVGTVMARFSDTWEKTHQLHEPKEPDDQIRSLRAHLSLAIRRQSIRREILEVAGKPPRSLEQLQKSLGTSDILNSGMERLRHPQEIAQWTELILNTHVRDFASVHEPSERRAAALEAVRRWLDQPWMTDPTVPMWREALAKLEAEWSPKLS